MHPTLIPREMPYTKREQPYVDAALKERAKMSVMRWLEVVQQRFAFKFYVPTVSFDLIGRAAGIAYWRSRHIRLNHVLLRENFDHFDKHIIPHELAHLICRHIHGEAIEPHGPEWQVVMLTLGVQPDRTHSLDVTNSRTTPKIYGYVCSCNGNNWLSQLQHKRSLAGAVYTCRQCKGPMAYHPPAEAA
jgi:SprT protein